MNPLLLKRNNYVDEKNIIDLYMRIINDANEIVLILSHNGKIIFGNRFAEKTYGYTIEELKSMTIFQLRKRDISECFDRKYKVITSNTVEFESVHKRKNNSFFYVKIKMINIKADKTDIYACIITDITETKLKEDKLSNQKNKSMKCVEKIIDPISSIIDICDILDTTQIGEQYLEHVNNIKQQVTTMINSLDIKPYETIYDEEDIFLNNFRFNIRETLKIIIEKYTRMCSSNNLSFYYHIDPSIPDELIGDELKLRTILDNLLDNAVKYTDAGAVILKVYSGSRLGAKINLRFVVEDTGKGISEEVKKSIFGRIDENNKVYREKSLFLSMKMIKTMNGQMWCISKQGMGSKFNLMLEFTSEYPNFGDDINAANKKEKTVLVVQNNAISMKATEVMLENLGYNCIKVYNGRKILDKICEQVPDLILMDIEMSALNSYEITRLIRLNKSKDINSIPIIAMVVKFFTDDNETWKKSGINDYLLKPLEINKLEAMLKTYIN